MGPSFTWMDQDPRGPWTRCSTRPCLPLQTRETVRQANGLRDVDWTFGKFLLFRIKIAIRTDACWKSESLSFFSGPFSADCSILLSLVYHNPPSPASFPAKSKGKQAKIKHGTKTGASPHFRQTARRPRRNRYSSAGISRAQRAFPAPADISGLQGRRRITAGPNA